MARADILLRAGIKFDPKDVDTKAIKDAVVKTLATTTVTIGKAKFGKATRDALQQAFAKVVFRVNNAKFGRDGLTALRRQFKANAFSINNVAFTKRALTSLNKQLKRTKFEIATAAPTQRPATGAGAAGVREQVTAQDNLATAIGKTRRQFVDQQRGLEAFAVGVTGAERANRNFLQTVAQGSQNLKGFGANIVKITQRFSAYLISIKAILLVQQAFNESLSVIFRFDAALQDLQKVLRETPEGLERVSKGLFEVAAITGRSVFEVADSFGIFRRAIDDNIEALERAQAALIATNISELTVAESTKLVTSAFNIFGAELDGPIEALDLISVTADNAATTAAELARGVLRSGAAAEAVGVSFKQLNAIIAATEEATKLGGATIGSALKIIFARLATNTSGLRENANALGANLKASDTVFESLGKLAAIFPRLNKEQKAQIAATVAGKRRFTEFNAIIKSFGKVNELLEKQVGAAGTALAKNEIELSKLDTAVVRVKNEFTELIVTLAGAGEGAEGFATIRNTLAQILEVVLTIPQALNSVLGFFGELKGIGDGLRGVFKGLVLVGLFKLGPAILKSLVAGAKTFLGVGKNIAVASQGIVKILDRQVIAERAVNDQEKLLLANLEKEKRIRQEIAAINRQFQGTGLPTGGRIRGVVQGRGGGRIGEGPDPRGLTRFQRAVGLATRGVDKLKSGFSKAREAVNRNSIGLALATSVATSALSKTAEEIRKLGGAGNKFGADIIDAGANAGDLAVSFGLMFGPIGAVTAGLFALSKGLAEAFGTFLANIVVAAEATESALTGVVTEAEAFAIAGADGVKIFDKIKTSGGALNEEIADEIRFFNALGRSIEDGTSAASRALNRTTEALDSLTKAAKANASAIELRKAVKEATAGFEKRIATLDIQAEFGDVPGLSSLVEATAEVRQNLKEFNALGGEIPGFLTKSTRLLTTASELLENTDKTQKEIVVGNLLLTDELRKQTELIGKQKTLKNDVISLNRQDIEDAERQIRSIEAFIKGRREEIQRVKERQEGSQAIINLEREIEVVAANLVKEEERLNDAKRKEKRLTAEIAELERQRGQVVKGIAKSAVDFLISLEKQTTAAKVFVAEINKSARDLERQNDSSEKRLAVDKQIAVLQLRTGAEAKRGAAIAAINLGGQEKIRQKQQEINDAVKDLNDLATKAADQGLKDQAAALKAAATEAQAAAGEEIAQITRQIEIEIEAKKFQLDTADFIRGEQILKEFRIRQIDEVVRKEQEAANRRIAFIERIGQTAAGREFIRQAPELRPTPGLERDFGTVRAAIIDQLTGATDIAVQGMVNKIKELQVNGVNTFQELNALKEKEKSINDEIASAQRAQDPRRLAAAQADLAAVQKQIGELTERGADNFKQLQEASKSSIDAIAASEELLAQKRAFAIELLEEAAEKVNVAEKALVTERNKIPALNQKIIASQKKLAAAAKAVDDATKNLAEANQSLADANFKLAFDVALAGIKARQAAGGFAGVGETLGALRGAFEQAVQTSKASFEAILEARRSILQEELSLVQNQLQSFKSLALEAASADPETLQRLQQTAAAAQAVARGADVAEFPPEIIQGFSKFFNVIPGLEQAVTEFGARQLGLDPSVFKTLEDQLVTLSQGIAETGQIQVEQAEEAVRTAQLQLEEARNQKDLAQQQLENAIEIKQQQLAVVAQASQNVSVARSGFRQQSVDTRRLLAQNKIGSDASRQTAENIKFLREVENKSLESIKKQTETIGEQLGIIKKVEEKTAEVVKKETEVVTGINFVKTAIKFVEDRIAEFGGRTIIAIDNLRTFLARRPVQAAPATPGGAHGTLGGGEINSLLRAAQKEKSFMPSGARLMLANTSETVLTRRQAKKLGLKGRPQTHAQGGNAVVTPDLVAALAATAENLGSLNTQLENVASRAAQPQNVSVSLNSDRTISIEGINNLESDIQAMVEQELGKTPNQQEVDTINETVKDIVRRLQEDGNENFTGV